jgi:hypothetical protein
MARPGTHEGNGARCRTGRDKVRDDFKTAQEVSATVRFRETGVAIDCGQDDLRQVSRSVEDAEMRQRLECGGDFRAEPAVGKAHVDHDEIGLVKSGECDRLGDGARDSTHVISTLDKKIFSHVGDHEVVFGNQDFLHANHLLAHAPPASHYNWHHDRASGRFGFYLGPVEAVIQHGHQSI